MIPKANRTGFGIDKAGKHQSFGIVCTATPQKKIWNYSWFQGRKKTYPFKLALLYLTLPQALEMESFRPHKVFNGWFRKLTV